jgi:thioredoxin 1
MSSSNVTHVTDDSFAAQVEQNEGLTLVDFWAAWCGPCVAIAPAIDQLADELVGKVKIAKLDTDANQRTAIRFNVRSIPSILFFVNGKHVDTVVGGHPSSIKNVLTGKIQQHSGETVKK